MNAWTIQQEVLIEAPVEQVWRWVTTPELVGRWWCPPPTVTLDFELEEGGYYEEHYRDGGYEYDLTGSVLEVEPPNHLRISRDIDDEFGPTDLIGLHLSEKTKGTSVVVEHSFPALPTSRREEAEALYTPGWAWSLDRLRGLLTGGKK